MRPQRIQQGAGICASEEVPTRTWPCQHLALSPPQCCVIEAHKDRDPSQHLKNYSILGVSDNGPSSPSLSQAKQET